ncbi:hypothetical protein ABZ471_47330 [Streptomyces sp. NPDC005728]
MRSSARASSPEETARLGAIGLNLVATVLAGQLGARTTCRPRLVGPSS